MNPKKLKVLILGLGRYEKGTGVSSAVYFAEKGCEVRVTDALSADDLRDNAKQLKKYNNVKFHLGKFNHDDIAWADLVAKNPGVRRTSPEMKEVRRLGKPVTNDITEFLKSDTCMTIGVTGTRGKSTTASWIADMLEKSGKKIHLGGNITVSPLTFMDKTKKTDIAVLELSSWMLETTGENALSPQIAVWTNVMNDHLNTYDGLEDYAEAKAQIMRHQRPGDIFIANMDDRFVSAAAVTAPGVLIKVSINKKVDHGCFLKHGSIFWKDKRCKESLVIKTTDINLQGKHNIMNAMLAIAGAKVAGATMAGIRKSLKFFTGVPYRQQIIAEKNGVIFVDDTTATTPDAAKAALERFAAKGKLVHWICGGADKDLPFDDFVQSLEGKKLDAHLLRGTALAKLEKLFKKRKIKYMVHDDLKSAFKGATKFLKKNEVVLLSPACASFGLFKNEFDRGEQFDALVKDFLK